ncbi:hypothetical protein [Aeoliella mucimassa]|uniref:Uncharacterized protein n=1 Tax=Aeoliella mucimassa TaxID=2527972 RepID=A0A518AU08_9BACT|nr:hypothetical protein [Aeoliella mucimassa]QDU58197.1 hypothetical protein Pan181_44300 [Aeoliella mucimassa]
MNSTPSPALADLESDSAELLRELVGQVARLNERLDRLDAWQQAAESFGAIAIDVVDEQAQQLSSTSTPANERFEGLTALIEHLTRKSTIDSLTKLLDRAPQLEQLAQLADKAPDAIAAVVDVADEWVAKQSEQGINVAESLRRSLHVAMWLTQQFGEVELERLTLFLRSGVVDPNALQIVSNAATALVECQRESCEANQPKRAGIIAALRSLSNPHTQQSLAFAIRFSDVHGKLVGKSCIESPTPQEPTS